MEWIRCIDKLPKPFELVIVHGGVAIHNGTEWYTATFTEWPGKPIKWPVYYWMPLPEPPTE